MNYLYDKCCNLAFVAGMKIVEMITCINSKLLYVYDNNIVAKQLTDITIYYVDMVWCDYYNAKCDVLSNINWYGTSCLVNNSQNNHTHSIIRKIPITQSYYKNIFKHILFMQDGRSIITNDKYTIKDVHNDSNIDSCVSNVEHILDNELSLIGDIKDCVFLLKYFNVFIVRCAMEIDMERPKIMDFIKSNVSFLSVEYTHPKMSSTIFFEISDCYSIIDNELFSPAFVKYLLEHQYETYIFDDEYVLNIMDDNMDVHALTHVQYIKIQEDDFIINNINEE